MRIVVLIVSVVLVLTGLALGQSKIDPTLAKLASEFELAYNAKDAAKIASFYADDAVIMAPGLPIIKGRPSIEAHYLREVAQGATMQVRPFESQVAGASGFEAGTVTVTLGSRIDNGRYVLIYKRVGREWKIAYDIFNSDPPPASR
jgi:ketosteroid isomerase-like protein